MAVDYYLNFAKLDCLRRVKTQIQGLYKKKKRKKRKRKKYTDTKDEWNTMTQFYTQAGFKQNV